MRAKARQVERELKRRGLRESAMGKRRTATRRKAKTTDETEPVFCEYPGCDKFPKRNGLCVKHLVALRNGDPEAVEVVERRKRLAACAWTSPKPTAAWRHYPDGREAEAAAKAAAGPKAPPVDDAPTTTTTEGPTEAPERENAMAKQHVCEDCGKPLKTAQGLAVHRSRIHGKRGRFADKKANRRTAPPPGDDGRYVCEVCGKPFDSLRPWIGHQKQHRTFAGDEPPPAKMKTAVEPTAPPPTGKEETPIGAVEAPEGENGTAKKFVCAVCGMRIWTDFGLDKHSCPVHGKQETPTPPADMADGRKHGIGIRDLIRRFDLPLALLKFQGRQFLVHTESCEACLVGDDGRLSPVQLHVEVQGLTG